jgi:hypothetical protein
MDNLNPINVIRSYKACLTIALVGLFGMATVPSFGQCAPVCPAGPINVACTAIPAPVTTGAGFITLGGTIGDPNCALISSDVYSSPFVCQARTLTRTYTGANGNCAIVYNVAAAPLPTMPTPPAVIVPCGTLPPATTLTFSNGVGGACDVSGTSAPSVLALVSPATCGAGGAVYTETWTASDACGRVLAPVNRTVTVALPALPTLAPLANATIACGAALVPTMVPFTNGLGGGCGLSSNSLPSTFSSVPPACGGTIIETWNGTDACGRVLAAVSRTITVSPAPLPVMPLQGNLAVACGAIPAPSTLPFTNSAVGACGILGTSALSTFSPVLTACGGVTTETWTATDFCGRALAPVSRTITVAPAPIPTMTAPVNITVSCGGLPAASALTFSNGVVGSCLITGTSALSTFSAIPSTCTGGIVTQTWTATDACGRALTPVSRTITILPALMPTMVAPANITGVCGSLPAASTIPYSNGLTGDCAKTGVSALSTFSTLPACAGVVIETWTATDACGRTIAPVSRTIYCNSGLSCTVRKVKDTNCDGYTGSATASLTGGTAATYQWDNGETTATATQLIQGFHTVTITTAGGCITTCSVSIGNTAILDCSVVANSGATCGSLNGSATVTATGGASNIRFVWDNQETTATATRLSAGTHTVRVISGNCSKTCSVTIGSTGGGSTVQIANCSKTDATCGQNNGTVTAGTVSGATGTVAYTWRNAANEVVGRTSQVTNLPAGDYTLFVNDNCSEATCTVTVGSSTTDCDDPHFHPVATTCCTYSNGSSKALGYLGYKTTDGRISEVYPSTFYYYTKVVAPSSDFTVAIVQTKDVVNFSNLLLNGDHIQLWDLNCTRSVRGTVTANGGSVAITEAEVGATYVLEVRLQTRPLLSALVGSAAPTVNYTIASYINTVLIPNSRGNIRLKPTDVRETLNAGVCRNRAPGRGTQEDALENTALSVQPNPAQSIATVLFESASTGESVVSVANINGAIVQTMTQETKQGENTIALNIQALPVGTYIVTVKTAQQWMTKQLVILR